MGMPINGAASRSAAALPLLKLCARGRTELTLQSADVVLINTHWIGRRLWCAETECPGCDAAAIRTVAYFVGMWPGPAGPRPLLVETTPNELARLQGFVEMQGLSVEPGLVIECSREKPKSPLRMEPVRAGGHVVDAFRAPRRALAAAAVLAGVPGPTADSEIDGYCERVKPVLRSLLERAIAKSRQ